MVKKIEIFAPEDLEFDMSALGIGVYRMPGDIKTEKVLKLMALGSKMRSGDEEAYEKMIDILVSLFEPRHNEKELKELKDNLGMVVINQIIDALYEHIEDVVGEAKNRRNRAKARK